MKVSIYRNIKSVIPIKDTSVFKVLDLIQNGKFKEQVSKIRIEADKDKRNVLKQNLANATFCGTFESRANKNLKKHSGLCILDFDNILDAESLREKIKEDKYTFSAFRSPSENGLKVLVKIPFVDNNDDYNDYFTEVANHYKQYTEVDLSGKDIARTCFLSYDSNLYLNQEAEVFTDKYYRPIIDSELNQTANIPLTDQNEIANRLDVWFQKRWSSTNRNTNLHAYARQMNAFGVDKSICESYLLRYEQPDFKAKEIKLLINSAYKYTNQFNTKSFEDTKKANEIKNIALAGEPFKSVLRKFNDLDEEKLQKEFKVHKNALKTDEYWYYTEKDSIKLSSYRFMQFLESHNIFKFYPDKKSGAFSFIKKDENFVSIFEEPKIKDYVLTDLRGRGLIDVFELMVQNPNNFSRNYLSMVSSIDVKFNKDKFDSAFIYYKNGAIEITKDDIIFKNYKEIDDLIWSNQVINRNVSLSNESEGVFKTFIWLVSGKNVERYYTLKSVIGYLMHSFQNEAKPKAIIFNDEKIDETDLANGGSGKGLIHRAIGQIKNIVVEDGKKFDPRAQFAYQKIDKDTQVFLMDDVPKNFNFESLFSIITEGITVEKKNKDAFQIPFNESPKISITTNYTIQGDGASFKRRVFEVEIANYFNENHTPEDEFGHHFFSDWDEQEWSNFDNFMIRCLQFFLKNGLVESDKINLDYKKFKNELGSEFIEFMELRKFDGEPINRKELRDEFNKQYPLVAKYNSPQKFNKKVKMYCDFNKISFEESKYNGVVYFYIGCETKSEDYVPF